MNYSITDNVSIAIFGYGNVGDEQVDDVCFYIDIFIVIVITMVIYRVVIKIINRIKIYLLLASSIEGWFFIRF